MCGLCFTLKLGLSIIVHISNQEDAYVEKIIYSRISLNIDIGI